MSVVANNTVLSNFASVDELECLSAIFQIVYLTPEIRQEVIDGVNEGYTFQLRTQREIEAQRWLFVTELTPSEQQSFSQFRTRLDDGEATCLAAAQERGWLFLTDDRAARTIANQVGVNVTGTIGVLLIAIEQGQFSHQTADSLLGGMIANGYFSPVQSLAELLEG
jgi:predicted nucleic acid-binding protein